MISGKRIIGFTAMAVFLGGIGLAIGMTSGAGPTPGQAGPAARQLGPQRAAAPANDLLAWPSELPLQKPSSDMRWIDVAFPGSESLAASRDKWTVVNFWATWCGPCVAELGDFNRLATALDGDVGVFVINVADKKMDGPGAVAAMFAKKGYVALKPLYAPEAASKALLVDAGLGSGAPFPITLIFAPGGKPYGFVNDTTPNWYEGNSGWGGAGMISYFRTLAAMPAPN